MSLTRRGLPVTAGPCPGRVARGCRTVAARDVRAKAGRPHRPGVEPAISRAFTHGRFRTVGSDPTGCPSCASAERSSRDRSRALPAVTITSVSRPNEVRSPRSEGREEENERTPRRASTVDLDVAADQHRVGHSMGEHQRTVTAPDWHVSRGALRLLEGGGAKAERQWPAETTTCRGALESRWHGDSRINQSPTSRRG